MTAETEAEVFVENFLDERLLPVLTDKPAVILYKGEQVKLPSGKSAWKNKGAARIALTQALTFHYSTDKEMYKLYRRPSDLRKDMEQKGIITIKEFQE